MNSPEPHDTSGELYTLETLTRITRISKDRIVIYQQHGLISPVQAPPQGEPRFDDEAIHRLRRISLLLSEYGVNEKGLQVFFSLVDEVDRLRDELRFHRH
jgi:DNA-binding transcriptional MerR regulator